MNKDEIFEKILAYIESNKKVTVGDIYIKFHMMNKGNEFSKEGEMPISARDIKQYIKELEKQNKIICVVENEESFYELK